MLDGKSFELIYQNILEFMWQFNSSGAYGPVCDTKLQSKWEIYLTCFINAFLMWMSHSQQYKRLIDHACLLQWATWTQNIKSENILRC